MASTSSQIPWSSTSPPTSWDVFLSFRGETRYNFTSHLYSALDRCSVRTYKDDPELRSGEVISDALIKAIKESKTYVVVLSENYASSSWCLDELVEILNCHKTMQRLVIPVFYNIDPSVARHQIGRSFKEAFEVYKTRFVGERVNKWRLALTEVANFSGKHISQNRSEADIINEIVDEIVLKINPKTLDVAKYPVGLDSHVKGITALLSSATEEGVIKIGIYGMGGIGKTTLAKALFNQLLLGGSFKGSCFLANVREISGPLIKGIVTFQEQLVNDVLKSTKKVEIHSVDQGTKLIGARICSTKILLVIDDLDDHKQFESLVGPFASGSVVILTTRNQEILDKIEVETRYRYGVNELDDTESLELFTRHAFGNDKPNNTFMVLCKDIVRYAGGLPLALEVFGSYLYKRSEAGWKSYIERLQQIPDSTIQQRLIISLDALESDDPKLKKIFLDISCVFIGMEKERVVEILETYYFCADHYIDILKKRCLLTINHRDELRMHDLLQDMGREIARNDSPDEPGKHSRLWVPKDICDVLKKHKGTEAIEVIVPPDFVYEWREESFRMESFGKMSKLRFLYLNGVNLTGNFGHALEDLRWFRWNHCPLKCLPSKFYPKKLVILELRSSKLRTMWKLNMVSHVFEKFKTLDMSFSKDLTTTPDFTRFPCLETLLLCGCEKLRSLPDTICNLRLLRSLNIGRCSGLKALPIELGNIESLTELHASGINVSKLPDSLGRLTNLVTLELQYSRNLETLPDTICNSRALRSLMITGCSGLKALPKELGNIESLTELHAFGINVSKLPDSLGRLTNLVTLNLQYSRNLETLPDTICNLGALRSLNIAGCSGLKALPKELGNIESLTELDAREINVSKFPDSLGRLTNLVTLDLRYSRNLETLPDTICNLRALRSLHIDYCSGLEALPKELGNIESLTELHALEINVSKLPDSLGRLTNLVTLDLEDNENLETLPDTICNLRSLETLQISGCKKLEILPDISQLSGLEELVLDGCDNLLSIPELPPSLKRLNAKGCELMERLPNLSNLKQLLELDLTDCSRCLTEIRDLEELTSIRSLHFEGCDSSVMASVTKLLLRLRSLGRNGMEQEWNA